LHVPVREGGRQYPGEAGLQVVAAHLRAQQILQGLAVLIEIASRDEQHGLLVVARQDAVQALLVRAEALAILLMVVVVVVVVVVALNISKYIAV
jgi:hypothetical protein